MRVAEIKYAKDLPEDKRRYLMGYEVPFRVRLFEIREEGEFHEHTRWCNSLAQAWTLKRNWVEHGYDTSDRVRGPIRTY